MSPDEIYKVLRKVDADPLFRQLIQASPDVALTQLSIPYDQSLLQAINSVDWQLGIDLLNEDIDFLMPPTPPVDWGGSRQYGASEWGARIDVDLNGGSYAAFLGWVKTFRTSLSLRYLEFDRFFLFSDRAGTDVYSLVTVWKSAQDAVNCLTDQRLGRLQSVVPGSTMNRADLVRDVFQVSGLNAGIDAKSTTAFQYCEMRSWTILPGQDGLAFRDNRYDRYDLVRIALTNRFLGELVGWSLSDPGRFYEIFSYSDAAGPGDASNVLGVTGMDTAAKAIASLDVLTGAAPAAWSAIVID
jgi:hypothetical protein